MSVLRIAIVGDGRMGSAVEELAAERGWLVTAVVGADDNAGGRGITRARLGNAEVVVEFTEPAAAGANVRACIDAGYPVVCGTTGWYLGLDDVVAHVKQHNGALVYTPNFSVGVTLFLALLKGVGHLMARAPAFDPHVTETHHKAKKDAPSGTALAMVRALAPGLSRDVPVTSIRMGSVPGTHELTFDGPFEQIRLSHTARDRRVFADGALLAAAWLQGKHGVFTMNDVLGLEPEVRG